MRDTLFGRRYTLTIGDTRVTDLRVTFKIKKTLTKEPNTAEISVFNLSETTRRRLQGKGLPVILSAGYEGSEAVIFSGDSRFIDDTRSGPDWIKRVRCGDGERAYQFNRFRASYGPGTPIATVIRDAAKALAVNPGNLSEALALPFKGNRTHFRTGYTANGDAIDVLETLLKSAGFSVSIQGGALQVLQGNAAVPATAVLLSPETGLIGSPELGSPEKKKQAPRMKARSLLQPLARCGGAFELRSTNVKGQFRAEVIEHSGDTAGQEWYTDLELKAV